MSWQGAAVCVTQCTPVIYFVFNAENVCLTSCQMVNLSIILSDGLCISQCDSSTPYMQQDACVSQCSGAFTYLSSDSFQCLPNCSWFTFLPSYDMVAPYQCLSQGCDLSQLYYYPS